MRCQVVQVFERFGVLNWFHGCFWRLDEEVAAAASSGVAEDQVAWVTWQVPGWQWRWLLVLDWVFDTCTVWMTPTVVSAISCI